MLGRRRTASYSCFVCLLCFFFFSSRRRHTRYIGDWSSDVCSSDLGSPARSLLADAAAKDLWIAAERAGDPRVVASFDEGGVEFLRAVAARVVAHPKDRKSVV